MRKIFVRKRKKILFMSKTIMKIYSVSLNFIKFWKKIYNYKISFRRN